MNLRRRKWANHVTASLQPRVKVNDWWRISWSHIRSREPIFLKHFGSNSESKKKKIFILLLLRTWLFNLPLVNTFSPEALMFFFSFVAHKWLLWFVWSLCKTSTTEWLLECESVNVCVRLKKTTKQKEKQLELCSTKLNFSTSRWFVSELCSLFLENI